MEPLLSVQTALTVFDMIKEHQACSKQNTQEIPLWGFVPKHMAVPGRKVKTNSAAKVSTNNTPHSPKIPINKFLKHKRVAGEGQISVLKRTEKPCLLNTMQKITCIFLFFFFLSSEWCRVLMGFPSFLLQCSFFLLSF